MAEKGKGEDPGSGATTTGAPGSTATTAGGAGGAGTGTGAASGGAAQGAATGGATKNSDPGSTSGVGTPPPANAPAATPPGSTAPATQAATPGQTLIGPQPTAPPPAPAPKSSQPLWTVTRPDGSKLEYYTAGYYRFVDGDGRISVSNMPGMPNTRWWLDPSTLSPTSKARQPPFDLTTTPRDTLLQNADKELGRARAAEGRGDQASADWHRSRSQWYSDVARAQREHPTPPG